MKLKLALILLIDPNINYINEFSVIAIAINFKRLDFEWIWRKCCYLIAQHLLPNTLWLEHWIGVAIFGTQQQG